MTQANVEDKKSRDDLTEDELDQVSGGASFANAAKYGIAPPDPCLPPDPCRTVEVSPGPCITPKVGGG